MEKTKEENRAEAINKIAKYAFDKIYKYYTSNGLDAAKALSRASLATEKLLFTGNMSIYEAMDKKE